jgi:transposase-like protein
MADKNVTYPVTEVLGFCDATVAMLNNRKTAMTALGVDPTTLITTIGTNRDTLNTQNTTQEVMKTALRDQTAVVDAAKATAYAKASNACDKVIDAFGSTSEQAKEARNLRKALHHQSRAPATPTPTPTP